MTSRLLLGMLTPSSNTVLEPVTAAMLAGLPHASAHFGRFKVTEIALTDAALGQFDDSAILAAAELLGHARLHTIAWNGTSAGWLGFDTDERLCARIEAHTGIRACTSVLALNEILRQRGVMRLGLVSPYRDDVQARIVANYRAAGIECVAERHLGLQDNYAFSEVTPDTLRGMVREVAQAGPQAIAIYCTNLAGAPLAAELEDTCGIPVYDTVATAVWKSLKLAGGDVSALASWGSLFREKA